MSVDLNSDPLHIGIMADRSTTAMEGDPAMTTLLKRYPVEQAVQAQKALREVAGLGPELFSIEAFVGMISDEIETLRMQGKTDGEIADLILTNSGIEITASEIGDNFAPPEHRHPTYG